jgi:Arc/MetJ family transcription regulator
MKKRTNVVLEEDLIEAGLELTGLRSRRALIDYALRQLLRRESQKKILELKGKVHWEGDLSSMRQEREFE